MQQCSSAIISDHHSEISVPPVQLASWSRKKCSHFWGQIATKVAKHVAKPILAPESRFRGIRWGDRHHFSRPICSDRSWHPQMETHTPKPVLCEIELCSKSRVLKVRVSVRPGYGGLERLCCQTQAVLPAFRPPETPCSFTFVRSTPSGLRPGRRGGW